MTQNTPEPELSAPRLLIRSADGRRMVPLDRLPLTIGRHSENIVRLNEPLASRFHCVIDKAPEGYRLKDLDSRNGTFINDQPIKVALLLDHDTIRIGGTRLVVELPQASNQTSGESSAGRQRTAAQVAAGPSSDPVEDLQRIADSLPDKQFDAGGIALLNARGKIAHPAGEKRSRTKGTVDAVDVLRHLLLICLRTRASDIHVEPRNQEYGLRIRVDGNMVDVIRLSPDIAIRLVSLVKILCDIDIAQRNIIQEGHFSATMRDRRADYRVSFAPAMFGQKLVIRILDAATVPLHLPDLQLPTWMLEHLSSALQLESGMTLVCGPTGSGKTTTLYALIRDLDISQRNVVTIEDPVEIQLEGVTQIPVNESQGNTFSSLLRSVLRQDPDAILVGEIRDPETARIALQAAMTGHLVFSTVHARDTISTIFRLLDLGVEPFLVSSALQTIVSQRLVRQLCPHCKRAVKPTAEQLRQMGEAAQGVRTLYAPVGCQRCLNTGFSGRRAIFELLCTNEKLRDALLKTPTSEDIQKALAGTRFQRLAQVAYQLVAQGVTAFDEVERATS